MLEMLTLNLYHGEVYIIAGPEFGECEDHLQVICKALYCLKSSGQGWHDQLHDCMVDLGFVPCKAEPDIWMKQNKEIWEYVAVYVDDLAIAMRELISGSAYPRCRGLELAYEVVEGQQVAN
jgi:Reverse transcriptase (RNA-dependent DNA polymerase)